MNQFQFYLAIVAAPVASMLTVLVGILINNGILNAQVRRLDEKIDSKSLVLEAHLRRLDEKIDSKFEVLEAHLRRTEDMLLGKFAELDNRLTRIEANLR